MPVTELNHYLIRANDLERTKDFYVNVLGFEVMPRPDFPVSRLLAGHQRQDPGPHGAGGRAQLRALLPRQPEERGEEQFRRDRPHRVSRHRAGKVRRSTSRSWASRSGRAAFPSPSCSSSSSRIRTGSRSSSTSSASKRRPRMGRRELLADAARAAQGAEAEATVRRRPKRRPMNAPRQARANFAGVAYEEAMRRARALVPALRERAAQAEAARVMPPETIARPARDAACCARCSRSAGAAWSSTSSPTSISRSSSPAAAPSTAWNLAQPADPPLDARDVRRARAGGGLGPGSRGDDRLRHRLPAGTGAPGGRRLRGQRPLEFLELRQRRRLEHARGDGARRRAGHRPPHVPAAQVAVRGRGRLAGARHARDRQHDGRREGRVRSRIQGARHVRGARRRPLSRRAGESQPGLSRAALGARRPRHRRPAPWATRRRRSSTRSPR